MTRDELIASIEAPFTDNENPELLCAIAEIAEWEWTRGKALSEWVSLYPGSKQEAIEAVGVSDWLTSLDAAVSLAGSASLGGAAWATPGPWRVAMKNTGSIKGTQRSHAG